MHIGSAIFVLLLFSSVIACQGQTLFFDHLKNSVWTSDAEFDVSKLDQVREIGLTKLRISREALTVDRTLWTFNDALRISYYDSSQKKDSTIAIFQYNVDRDTGTLKIIPDNEEALIFNAGIVSTGSFVLLMRKRNRGK